MRKHLNLNLDKFEGQNLKSQPFLLNNAEERPSTQPVVKIVKEVLPQKISCFISFKPKLRMYKGTKISRQTGEPNFQKIRNF